jgi:methylmalonyl-CoA/ethylmalonyl-CoA epimerase
MNGPLLPDLSVHHVGLSVRDLDESIAFWRDILGFEMDFKVDVPPIRARVAFMKRGGFRMELFAIEGSEPTPSECRKPNTDLATQGTKHVAFAVEDVQSTLETLFRRGVEIVGVLRGHGRPMLAEDDPVLKPDDPRPPAMALFLLDPSGILVEIVRRSDFKE